MVSAEITPKDREVVRDVLGVLDGDVLKQKAVRSQEVVHIGLHLPPLSAHDPRPPVPHHITNHTFEGSRNNCSFDLHTWALVWKYLIFPRKFLLKMFRSFGDPLKRNRALKLRF